MKTIFFFANLSLVIWLTLGSNEKQREINEEEVYEKILDREKKGCIARNWYAFFSTAYI